MDEQPLTTEQSDSSTQAPVLAPVEAPALTAEEPATKQADSGTPTTDEAPATEQHPAVTALGDIASAVQNLGVEVVAPVTGLVSEAKDSLIRDSDTSDECHPVHDLLDEVEDAVAHLSEEVQQTIVGLVTKVRELL